MSAPSHLPVPPPLADHPAQEINPLVEVGRAFFDAMHDDILLHDAAGQLVYANPALFTHVGVQSLDHLSQLFSQAQQETYKSKVYDTLSTHTVQHMVYHLASSKRQPALDEHLSFYPMLDAEKQCIGVLVHHIYQQYQQQLQLDTKRTQKAYLRSLIDNFPYPIWMKDEKGTYLSVNRQFCSEFGFAHPRDVLGKNEYDLFESEMAAQFKADDSEVMTSGMDKRVIQKIRRVDGSIYWGYSHKAPVRADQGIIGTVGFSRDISEEIRLQSEISELENEYALLVNSLPIGIMVYNLDKRRVFINAHYLSLIGFHDDDYLGKTPAEHWSPKIVNLTASQFEGHLQHVIDQGEPAYFDMLVTQGVSGHSIHDVKMIARRNKQGDICGVIAIVQDVTAIQDSRQRIEHQAHHDALTGLPNRFYLSKQLAAVIAHSAQTQASFAMLLLDLDGFKAINDSMGHNVGDQLLQKVAKRLQAFTPAQAFCCRLGGDEFAIILTGLRHVDDAKTFANHVLQVLRQRYHLNDAEYYISASIGIASYPTDATHADELIRLADTALYAAKDAGRNTWYCYDSSLSQMTERRFHLANALRNAIAQQELSLVFQPIVDISNRSMLGVEALCRWESSTLGTVHPMEFIPLAEQTGLITPLGLHIMGLAFDAAYAINQHSAHTIRVSVNVSAKQFNSATFIDQVVSRLHQHHCQPQWIKFEITETLLLEYNQDVLHKLNLLSEMGIMIVLDDFGTGHSALSYLMKFPIQQVKIDRSFVNDIVVNPNSAKLIKAIIALVNSMDKELVAEGLETAQQAQLIQDYGCRMVQGYLFSKPLSLADLLNYAPYPVALDTQLPTLVTPDAAHKNHGQH